MADEPAAKPDGLSRTVTILAAVVTVLGTAGGWVWGLSGSSFAVTEVQRRVTTIEQHITSTDNSTADIANRVARMEPMLEFLVSRMKK